MPLFICDKCHTLENTALSGYWWKGEGPALCSACDPQFDGGHKRFPREPWDGKIQVLNPPKNSKYQLVICKKGCGEVWGRVPHKCKKGK